MLHFLPYAILCLPVPLHFLPIFFCNVQHTKGFAVFFLQVFVVHFMGPANGFNIAVLRTGKPFYTLVDDDFVYKKIGKAISHDAKTNCLQPIDLVNGTKENAEKTGYCKNDKESIIAFKKTRPFLMVIFVEVPEKAMHNVFMGGPGNPFHHKENAQYNASIR